jgi:hypothetical protein
MGPNKAPHLPCVAFEKLDGSNIRLEWFRKSGWGKAGTRRVLLDPADPVLGPAVPAFMAKYAEAVVEVARRSKMLRDARRVTAFAEWVGPNSFAGRHVPGDAMDIVLFDVHADKVGLLGPRDFLELFGHLHVPKVVYEGVLNASFVEGVKEGKYPVVEGVVCKGTGREPWMRKVKTRAYMERLKGAFGQEWEKYWE